MLGFVEPLIALPRTVLGRERIDRRKHARIDPTGRGPAGPVARRVDAPDLDGLPGTGTQELERLDAEGSR